MVTRRFERFAQIFENAATLVMNLRGLAVHQFFGADNFAAKNLRDALMDKANAQNRNARSELANQIGADARAFRTAWSRRNANSVGLELLDLVDRNFVVPLHHKIDIFHLAEKLDEIVGERIVIIDNQQFHSDLLLLLFGSARDRG